MPGSLADASLVIHEGAGARSEHPVDDELILGREPGSADLVIEEPGVSRRHARVRTGNGTVIVEDLGSSNGTFVNGERISRAVELAAGDEIQVGATVLAIEAADAATALMPEGAPPTERHPGSPPNGPVPRQPPLAGRAAPRRLAPHPTEGDSHIPALAPPSSDPSRSFSPSSAPAGSSSRSRAPSPRSSSARSGAATPTAAGRAATAASPASAASRDGSARSSPSSP